MLNSNLTRICSSDELKETIKDEELHLREGVSPCMRAVSYQRDHWRFLPIPEPAHGAEDVAAISHSQGLANPPITCHRMGFYVAVHGG